MLQNFCHNTMRHLLTKHCVQISLLRQQIVSTVYSALVREVAATLGMLKTEKFEQSWIHHSHKSCCIVFYHFRAMVGWMFSRAMFSISDETEPKLGWPG